MTLNQRDQAALFRAALLLGLVRGDVVVKWADEAIATGASPSAGFVEIATTPPDDLTLLRLRLLALCDDNPSADVLSALLGLVHRDLASGRRGFADTMTVLKQLRGFLKVGAALNDQLKTLGVDVATKAPGAEQRVRDWLQQHAR